MSDPRVTSFCVRWRGAVDVDKIDKIYEKLKSNPVWMEKAILYAKDEPHTAEHFEFIRKEFPKYKERWPELKIIVPFCVNRQAGPGEDQLDFLSKYVDIVCPVSRAFGDDPDFPTYYERLMNLKENGKVIGSIGIEKYGLEEKLTEFDGYIGREIGYEEGKADGITEGKTLRNQEIWDSIPANLPNFKYMFAGPMWNKDTFYPTKNIVFSGILVDALFAQHAGNGEPYDLAQRLQDCGVTLDFSRVTRALNIFISANFTRLPEIDLSAASSINYAFCYMTELVTIDKLTVSASTTFSYTFDDCSKLENITFGGEIGKSISFAKSPLLTTASVQSIIDHLKDLTGATAQSLTLHADVKAKLSEEQLATITGKNWSVA
jgi:hypothetical protein